MPVFKLILITVTVSLLLFAGMLYLALPDSGRDLSKHSSFQSLTRGPHTLKKQGHLYALTKEASVFISRCYCQ